jgi:hypothetical protein
MGIRGCVTDSAKEDFVATDFTDCTDELNSKQMDLIELNLIEFIRGIREIRG